jgi:sporulation protein YlmC with PRC-barrel domain
MKHTTTAAGLAAVALALGGSAALAEQHQQMQGQQGQVQAGQGARMGQQSGSQANTVQKKVDQLTGMEVVTRQGKKIGDVNKVVRRNQDGQPEAVISVGGILDIGDKEIAVPLDQLSLNKDDQVVLPDSIQSKRELKDRPELDSSEYQEIAGSQQVDIQRSDFAAFEPGTTGSGSTGYGAGNTSGGSTSGGTNDSGNSSGGNSSGGM